MGNDRDLHVVRDLAAPAGRAPADLVDRRETGGGDTDGSAGGAGGNAPRGIDRRETGGGDTDGSAGGAGGNAPRGIDRTDEDLMAASAAGCREAFEVLVARYLPRLTSYCAKLTRDPAAAEDLAQDTLVALWHGRAGYRPDRALRLFVFTIALNRCRNHARSWRRRLRWLGLLDDGRDERGELDAVAAREPVHVDQLVERERQRRVRTALAHLPHHARAVLLLRFEQELSYAEIAAVVGHREVTVRSQVFHALRKLARGLEQESP